MSPHTPGPWFAAYESHLGHVVRTNGATRTLASDNSKEPAYVAHRLRSVADARLIAAAPRMLAVLKTMLSILGDYHALNQRTNDMRDETRAILRDVEGESNG